MTENREWDIEQRTHDVQQRVEQTRESIVRFLTQSRFAARQLNTAHVYTRRHCFGP